MLSASGMVECQQSIRDAGDRITDFKPGQDKIDLTLVLESFNYTGITPLQDGYIRLSAYSGGTVVSLDSDGDGPLAARPYIYLEIVQPEQLSAIDFLPYGGQLGEPPTIIASLVNDTGISDSDRLTYDPTIQGQISYSGDLINVTARLNHNPVNILALIESDGGFILDAEQLSQINGGSLPDGDYTLILTAEDIQGNLSEVYSYSFTLDQTAPILSLDLDPNFDSPPIGDQKTTFEMVTLGGTTEANLTVFLQSEGVITTANELGEFSFSNQFLELGDNIFIVSVMDLAGNLTTLSQTIERLPLAVNQAPTRINLDNNQVEEAFFGAVIGNITVIDPDTVEEFLNNRVTVNDDRFEVVINNGILQLKLKDDQSLDYETEPTLILTLTATDETDDSLTYSQDFTINVISIQQDTEPSIIRAALANDTGVSDSDSLTLDPTIIGETEGAAFLWGNLNGNGFVDISDALNEDGSFTISFEQYEVLTNALPDGEYILELKAINSTGQESEIAIVNFILDLTPPLVTFDLAPESDTGVLGDRITTERFVTLLGQTESELTVVLLETEQITTSDSEGNFSFTDVAMPIAGQAPFTVIAVDAAGNQGRSQQFFIREGINGAPEIISTPETLFDTATQATYTYEIIAIDPDNDPLTYTLLNIVQGAEIDENGILSFTPVGTLQPFYEFTVEVSDGRGGTDTQTFIVELPVISEQLGTIRGTVWDDLNGNSLRDTQGELFIEPGFAEVTVYLDLNNNGILDPDESFQITDETGQYEFTNLPPGTYIVRQIVPNGYVQTAPIGTVVGSVFDGEFNDEDWSRTYFLRGGPGPIVETGEQRLTGGNPDAYRHMIHEWRGGTNVIIYHRYEGYTYDPSIEGAFDLVDYMEDARVPNIWGNLGGGIVIYQDDKIFRAFGRAFNNFNWQTYVDPNLTKDDFQDEKFDGGFWSSVPGATPDFSESGSPMQFGFWRSNIIFSFQTIVHAIDNWSITLRDSKANYYKVNLSEGEIVENIDFGNTIGDSLNLPPRIVSNPLTTAYIGVPYQYNVTAIDPNGDILTYTLLNAPQDMEISETGVITWNTDELGSYQVEIQVDDGRGGIVTQSYELFVTEIPFDEEAPQVAFGFDRTVLNFGETVNFQISGQDNFGLATLDISVNGNSLTLNSDNIQPGVIYTSSFTPDSPGIYEVVATATDLSGNTDTQTLSVRVLDPNDTSAPIAEFDLSNFDPLNLVIREKTEIKGKIEDENLEFYRVDIAPVSLINLSNPAANNSSYITIAQGSSNIDGVLATIDPALYRNDSYFVRIYAQDINGNITVEGFGVGIDSQTKPGEFALEFTDLSIPLTGIPIEITRSYSSLDANFQGDFGYGWSLGLKDAQIVEAAPDGRDLTLDNFFGGNSFTVGTRVTLTTPDGQRVGFTFEPQIDAVGFLGPRYAPYFRPDPGVYDTLQVDYTPLSVYGDGSVGLYLFGFTYNPSEYILTTKDGTKYTYDQYQGLQTIQDRNGNTLTYTNAGIFSSTGQEIAFIRDSQGRITQILDPDNNALIYTYDLEGNLIGFTDRMGNETTFLYESDRPHYLTEIIDPLGRTGIRTEYDERGQISKIFDAEGNALDINYDSAASRQTIQDPFGNIITFVFDARGNLVSEIDALGGVTARTYDGNNNLLSETNPEGNTKSYTYDNRGNVLTETDGEGNTKTYTYNARNDILTETDPLGNVTTYTYDANGNLTSRQDALGNVTTYKYGLYGLLTEVIDANEQRSTFSYDLYGNLTELVDPTGAKFQFTYDRNGRVTSVIDALGAITNYVYDAQGRLVEQTDPEGNACGCGTRGITRAEYNAAGEKIAEIDALGRRTEYRYNSRGLLIETIFPDDTPDDLSDNPRIKNEYDALDRLIVTIDELGRKTHYIYDALGREIEVIYPDSTPEDLSDNPRTKTEYDQAGRVIAEIDELGNRTEYEYDQAGRLIVWNNALGEVITYTYDAAGRQVAMTDALGRTTNYAYDPLDRLIATTYANNAVMTMTYDPLGRVIAQTDLAGITTQYEYDALGRLTAVVEALGQRTEYKYDAVGNLIEQKDANGNITQLEYDSLRRRTAMILPLGQRSEMSYDKVGNLVTMTDFNGVVSNFGYDERDRLITKSFSDGTPTETFTYTLTGELATVTDNRGVTSYSYDERDRLLSRTEADGRTISYTYDLAGNILTLTVPSGTTTYTYDPLNRIDTVIAPDSGITRYTYNVVGNLIKTEFPNGVTENLQYDLLNRPIYLENRNQTGILSSYTYTLDAMGNRTKVEEHNGRIVEYSYDDLYRLTQEKITDPIAGNKTIEYVFDPVGNRLQRIDSVEGTTTYTYDANDRLLTEIFGGNLTNYQYDANGNLIAKVENGETQATYEWNAKGELVAVEVTENGEPGRIEFEYDHTGIRVAINIDGEETRFLIDNNQQEYAQVIEEYQPNGTVQNTYVHGWDLISKEDANGRIYYQVDGLGSTRLLTDNNGAILVEYDYDAYGNLTRKVGDVDNNYLFAGEQFDEAVDGYYLRARYYDQATGRFNSTDPFEGYNNQPVTLHDYLYASNNPANYLDPSGRLALIDYAIKMAFAAAPPAFISSAGGNLFCVAVGQRTLANGVVDTFRDTLTVTVLAPFSPLIGLYSLVVALADLDKDLYFLRLLGTITGSDDFPIISDIISCTSTFMGGPPLP